MIIFTARKRSLRRLCFYTCLSVILFTGGVPGQVHPPGQVHHPQAGRPPQAGTPLGRYTPMAGVPPPGQVHPPLGRYTPPRQAHPLAGTPPGQVHPPGRYPPPGSSACWEIRATSGRYASYWNAFLLFLCSSAGIY